MPTQQPLPHSEPGSRLAPFYLIRWVLSIATGAVLYLWIARSLIGVLVVIWYTFVTSGWLLALLSPYRRDVALLYLIPRAACTAIAVGGSYRMGLPWAQAIAASFVATVLLEGAFRLLFRFACPAALQRARVALDAVSRSARDGPTHMPRGRTAIATASVLLFGLAFAATACVFFARQVAFDTQFHLTSLHSSGLYDSLVQLASDAALDTVRSRSAGARRAADTLSDEDVRLAQRLILPEPWTSCMLAHSIDATLEWLASDEDRSMPAISLPLADVQRHVKNAASVLLDRYMPEFPLCSPDLPERAYCRPEGMSVAAFAATFKADSMATADKAFALIPAELDLATAEIMFPGPFRKPLAYLNRAQRAVRSLDRALPIAGIACLALLALVWFFAAYTPPTSLRWIGAALLLAGLGAWATALSLSAIVPYAAARWARDLLNKLPGAMPEAAQSYVQVFADTVYARLWPWALSLAGLGLALVLVSLLAVHSSREIRRLSGYQAVQAAVLALAAGSLVWWMYLYTGQQAYDEALQAERRGQIAEACVRYQQLKARYPLEVGEFVHRARRGRRECQLFLDAESAYGSADYKRAVGGYTAFLLGNPAIDVRYQAQAHLLDALLNRAGALTEAGERERALDCYRHIRDSRLDRGGHLALYGPVHIHRTIAELYLNWGDELLSARDPQAALATYRRILADTADPGLMDQAERRMVDAYCAWAAQCQEQGQADRAAGVCLELALDLPSSDTSRCGPCSP